MQLSKPELGDPMEPFFTNTGGAYWTDLTRLSEHDHTGGLNGKTLTASTIPDGSITPSKLDPSVYTPLTFVDGSKPFTGPQEFLADAVIRDALLFGQQGTALAPDATLARTAAGELTLGARLTVDDVAVTIGKTGAGTGGNLRLRADDGAEQWFFGLGGSAGARDLLLLDARAGYAQRASWGAATGTLGLSPVAAQAAVSINGDTTLTRTGVGALRVDTHLGVGVTPAAWDASVRAVQVGQTGSLVGLNASAITVLGNNTYSAGGAAKAIVTGAGSQLNLNSDGGLYYYTMPSAAAGANQTQTQRLLLSPTGTLTLTPDAGQAALSVAGAGTLTPTAGNLSIHSPSSSVTLSAASGYWHPSADNVLYFGHPSNRFTAFYAVNGTIQTSLADSKTAITPLDPAQAMAAVRNTQPVTFDYRPPERGAEWYDLPDDPEQAEAVLLQRLTAAPLEAGARHQAGVVLDDPSYPCADLFRTGEGQTNPSNSVGIILGALRDIDTRLAALETP
jgi:hypothetical protein